MSSQCILCSASICVSSSKSLVAKRRVLCAARGLFTNAWSRKRSDATVPIVRVVALRKMKRKINIRFTAYLMYNNSLELNPRVSL